ncbi:hypothetical protein KJ611_03710 [Patescibacteria group bacterium]|nr:hypothetical protein [Patescibacteria group bacterium]MBU1705737.1 hypothetical protein [Patescibacteria group bacterium]
MKKIMMLLLAAPILACGPAEFDPDGGNPGSFTATLSMSITQGVPPGDFLVDGEVVCTNAMTCEHKVHAAGVYEIESQGSSFLSVPATADVDDNGELVLLTITAGIPLKEFYITSDANCQEERELLTLVNNGKIEMRGFANINAEIVGNHYEGCNSVGYCIDGTIANDGESFQHHAILVGGNELNCVYSRK